MTFGAFLVGALSIIGLPPLGGTWSKWLLVIGAADVGQLAIIAVLMISSVLNVAYLLPLVARGFFLPAPAEREAEAGVPAKDDRLSWLRQIREAPLLCWLPPAVTAAGCIVLFFWADTVRDFLLPIAAGQ